MNGNREPRGAFDANTQLEAAISRYRDPNYLYESNRRAHQIYDPNTALHIVDLSDPSSAADSAIVVLYPFKEGDTHRMRTQLNVLQQSMDEPRRVIGIPNNTYPGQSNRGNENFIFEGPQLKQLRRGNLTPYAKRIWHCLNNKGVRFIDVVGLEQGASVAAVMPGATIPDYDDQPELGYVRSLTMVEPINVVERTTLDIHNELRQFSSRRVMLKMLNGTGIRDLPRLHPAYNGGFWTRYRQRAKELHYLEQSTQRDTVNSALLEGLGKNRLGADLKFGPVVPSVVVRGSESLVSPTIKDVDAADALRCEHAGLGKEIIFNPVLVAQIAKWSIDRATMNPADLLAQPAK